MNNVKLSALVFGFIFVTSVASGATNTPLNSINDIPGYCVDLVRVAREQFEVNRGMVLSLDVVDQKMLYFLSKRLINLVDFGFDFYETVGITIEEDVEIGCQVCPLEEFRVAYKSYLEELRSGWSLVPLQKIKLTDKTKSFNEYSQGWFFLIKKYYTGHQCCSDMDLMNALVYKFGFDSVFKCCTELNDQNMPGDNIAYILIKKDAFEQFKKVFCLELSI